MDSGATIDPSGERRLWPLPFAALILFSVFARLPARADTIVSLTFDDNTSGHATAAQILNQYGMKGTFYVNSARIGTSSAYLTLNQLRSIAASGHEIAGHTLNHLNLTQQSAAEARRQVCDDRAQLQAWGFNPVSFAYPFGAFNGSVQDIVEDCGYDNARTVGGLRCQGCPSAESLNPPNDFAIRTPESVKSHHTLAQLQQWVIDAEQAGDVWLPLVIHLICDNCGELAMSPTTLNQFLAWLQPRASQGTIVRTVAEVMGTPPPTPAPVITSLSPNSVTAGGPGFTLTVTGANFVNGSIVRWNGSNRATTFVNAATLRAAIPASDIASPQTASVTVFTSGAGLSAPAQFTVSGAFPPPPPGVNTVVSLTFDDGSSDQTIAHQLLDQHGLKGTFYINSGQIGTSSFYLSRAQLDAMNASGHEIAGHTLTHPDLTTVSQAEMERQICEDRQQIISWGFDADSFAYPFGRFNENVKEAAADCGYVSAREVGGIDCAGCPDAESIPPADAYAVRTPESFESITTLAQMQDMVVDAEQSGGGWLPLVFHRICNGCDRFSTSSTTLNSFLGWLSARASGGTVVRTVADVMGASTPSNPAPTLVSIIPSSAAAGGTAFTLTVRGANFINGSVVRWNGANRTTAFVSASTLTASIPASDIASAGTAAVTVFTPAPGGGTSSPATFTINSTSPPPPSGSALFSDTFGGPDRLITNEFAFYNPDDPAAVHSPDWYMTSGSLFANNQQGWTGVPDNTAPNAASSNGNHSAVFRLITKRTDFGNVAVSMSLINQGFVSVNPPQAYDAVRILTRYVNSNNFYQLDLNRRSNQIMIRKKLNGTTATLATAAYAAPLNTAQNVRVTTRNNANGSVNLTLSINGTQMLSSTDTTPGALGGAGSVAVSADNVNFRFDDFLVTDPTAAQPTNNPVPTIVSISPSSATAGSPGFTLTVNGSNFISSSTVRWNGANRPTTFVNGTSLTASIPASDMSSAGTATVTVFNPAPGGGTSNAASFTTNPASSSACVTSNGNFQNVPFSPQTGNFEARFQATPHNANMDGLAGLSNGPADQFIDLATVIRFSTAGFIDARNGGAYTALSSIPYNAGTVYEFGLDVNVPGHTYNAYVRVSSDVPTSQNVVGGDWKAVAINYPFRTEQGSVTTLNNLGVIASIGSETVCDLAISTVQNPPVPLISSISPSTGPWGKNATITVFGTNFTPTSRVCVDGGCWDTEATTTFVSESTLTFTTGGQFVRQDELPLSVINRTADCIDPVPGCYEISNTVIFNLTGPLLEAISPSSATAGGPGFTLTATGGNFESNSTVRWNGSDRPTNFISNTQITASIPASDIASPGTAAVTVFTPGPDGGSSDPLTFTIQAGSTAPPPSALFSDTFSGPDRLITNEFAFYNPNDPNAVHSPDWFMTSGSLFANNQQGWTGVPDNTAPNATSSNGNHSSVFRLITKRADFGNVAVSASVINQGFVAVNPTQPYDAIRFLTRYVNSNNFYQFDLNRRSNQIMIRKKLNGTTSTLATAAYTAPLNTAQNMRVTTRNNPNGSVNLTLSINGAQLLSSTDTAPGALGGTGSVAVSADNVNFRFDDFLVTDPTAPPPTQNPAPSIASISPSSATAGSPAFTLTVNGSNFLSSSTVRWNGSNRITTFVSSSMLTAAIPASDASSPGTSTVTVFNPAPGGGLSNGINFVVHPPTQPSNWRATDSMTHARPEEFTATLLTDGRVISIGGQPEFNEPSELYDPIAGVWSDTGETAVVRWQHRAPLLPNGKVWAVGGWGNFGECCQGLSELYEPSSGTFSFSNAADVPAGAHTATLLYNGKVLVTGSNSSEDPFGSNRAFLYDPATDTSTTTAPMSIARWNHTATLLAGGRVLVVGGGTWNGTTHTIASSAEIYNPASGTWSPVGSMSTARMFHTATLLPNGDVLVTGGSSSSGELSSAEIFNPSTNLWSSVPAMSRPRTRHSATRLPDGRILIAGGPDSEMYDPDTGNWIFAGNMTTSRVGHQAALLNNGNVLVVAGDSSGRTAEIFTPPNPGPNPPPAAFALSPSSAAAGGTGFFLLVSGTNFAPGSVVRWNGTDRPTSFFNSSQLRAAISSADIASAGTASVTVFNPGGPLSNALTFTITPPPPSGCVSSFNTWENLPFASQAGGFEARFAATPGANNMDGVAGLSNGSANEFTDLAAIVRFSTAGFIDARNGGGYAAMIPIPYSGGIAYNFRLQVNLASHTYNVFVSSGSFPERQLANNFAFRTEQGAVTSLNNMGLIATVGSETVCDLTISTFTPPQSSSWTATGSMANARHRFTANLLGDGSVLVTGGDEEFNIPAERYVPSSGTWFQTGTPSVARYLHTATTLNDGRVLVAGGWFAGECCFNTAEVYNPATGSFMATTNTMRARGSHTATLLSDGRVLLAGSASSEDPFGQSHADIYNPTTNNFAATGSMSIPRWEHTASLLPNGTVLVAGGGTWNGVQTTVSSSAEIFDPASGAWTPANPMSVPRHDHTATTLPDGRIFVVGGSSATALASAEIYNPATGNWSPAAPMAQARSAHSASLIDDGRVLVSGGTGGAGPDSEIYDPASNTWISGGSMSEDRSDHISVKLRDGRVLAAGGRTSSGPIVATAELFNVQGSSGRAPLFVDNFNRPDGLVTNEYATYNPNDPNAVISPDWTMTSGSLFVNNQQGWTGVPDNANPDATSSNGNHSAVFRLISKRADFGDIGVSMSLINQGFVSVNPAQAYDAVRILTRYVNGNNFYQFDLNRRSNQIMIRKKANTTTTLATVGYAVPFDAVQNMHVTTENNPDGSVTLTLSINGVRHLSATDGAPGPLAAAGAVAVSADNVNFRFDDFTVTDLNAGSAMAAVKPCAPCRVEREEADPTFVFRDLFVFPNPAREGAAPTIHFAAGVGDSVKIRIFDIAGTEVHGAILDQRPAVIRYEGKLRYAYEFPWRGHIPSGVYLYSIEAEKQGHPSIRKTGRFAVVR